MWATFGCFSSFWLVFNGIGRLVRVLLVWGWATQSSGPPPVYSEHTHTTQRHRELHFRALTMEAPRFASSSPLTSRALTPRPLSSSSSLLFRRNSFRKNCYSYSSAKFKSPSNFSVQASGDSGTLSLTRIIFKLSDHFLMNYYYFF